MHAWPVVSCTSSWVQVGLRVPTPQKTGRHGWSSCEPLALAPGVWVALAHSAYLVHRQPGARDRIRIGSKQGIVLGGGGGGGGGGGCMLEIMNSLSSTVES